MRSAPDGFGETAKKLVADARELGRLELELAKRELGAKGRNAAIGVVLVLVAVSSLLLVVGVLVAAAILAVAIVLPGWAAALVVAGLLAIVAGLAAAGGIALLRSAVPSLPKQALTTTKENAQWLMTRLKSVKR